MANKRVFWALVLFVLALGGGVLALQESESKSNPPDIRAQIVAAAAQLVSMESVDLPIPGVEVLCLQAPHTSESELERLAGRDIKDFERMSADTHFRLHVFSGHDRHEQLLFDDKLTRINYAQLRRPCEKTNSLHLERRDEFVLVSLL